MTAQVRHDQTDPFPLLLGDRQNMRVVDMADIAPGRLFGLWPGRTTRGSGGRNDRRGIRIWNRSRLHYLRVHAFLWLDDTTAFIQFIAETLVSIRGRVSILRASLGGETNPSLELSADYQPDHQVQ